MIVIMLVLDILGLIVVPLALWFKMDMKTLPIWGNSDGIESWYTGSKFWWYAIRNPANNVRLLVKRPDQYTTLGETDLESRDGLQWTYRYSGWLDCFRVTWGKQRPHKGKREFYIGWKLGNDSVEGIAFTVQLRL